MAGDFMNGFGTALVVMGVGAVGAGAVAAGGIGYAANRWYFEPNARAVEFNQRAQNVLASRSLRTISVEDFVQGDDGCAKPLYGAKFVAESAQGQVVRGALCVSRTTEMSYRPARP